MPHADMLDFPCFGVWSPATHRKTERIFSRLFYSREPDELYIDELKQIGQRMRWRRKQKSRELEASITDKSIFHYIRNPIINLVDNDDHIYY